MEETVNQYIGQWPQKMNAFTLSQTSPGFYLSAVLVSLLKTLWEKEKLLVTSNFSFAHSILYPFEELSAICIKFKIVIYNLFQFEKSKIRRLGKG